MKKCSRCKSDLDAGIIVTEWGHVYQFCKRCSSDFEHIKDTGGSVKRFIDNKNNQVSENMYIAKERRNNGETLWKIYGSIDN